MTPAIRRHVARGTAVMLLIALVAGGRFALEAAGVAVGHTAKTLCSGVFVSKREPAAVLRDLFADDLAVLRHIDTAIDLERREVSATVAGLGRRAIFREGLGCTLVLDGLLPPAPSIADTIDPVSGSGPATSILAALHQVPASAALQRIVAQAFAEPDPERRRRTIAIVIVHEGRIVGEQYAGGITPETPLPGWSMTKTVMNALAAVLVRDGRLALAAPVPIPEWRGAGDGRAVITLDHLLRMSSGLDFHEGMASPRADVMRMLFGVGDAAGFAIRKHLHAAPGTRWQYSSGSSNILARVLREALADGDAYLAFPRRALFDPLGMGSAVLETDAAGTFIGSSYMHATARDWARLGMLYVQNGVWSGERILPHGWVAYTSSPAPADPEGRYGAHVWLQISDGYAGGNPRLPVQALHAVGHEGQFVTRVPSRQLVIVRLGRTRHAEAWDHAAFVRRVLGALDDADR